MDYVTDLGEAILKSKFGMKFELPKLVKLTNAYVFTIK